MMNSDLNVYRFVKMDYKPGYRVESHKHSFFHMFYILKGSGELKISDKIYNVEKDELYLVPPGAIHSIKAEDSCNFRTVEIKFIPKKRDIIKELKKLPVQIISSSYRIKQVLNELIQEAVLKDAFFEDLINIKFTEIILHTIRENMRKGNSADNIKYDNTGACKYYSQLKNGVFDKIIAYINNNLNKKVEVSELADMAGFSEAYFCTIFKEHFKMSPGQYISSLKLEKAKELIQYSELNISQIAAILGFSSLHYFSRFFKNREGISPHRFLLQTKNHIFLELINGVEDDFKYKS